MIGSCNSFILVAKDKNAQVNTILVMNKDLVVKDSSQAING
jgi:hypothetical protein